METFFIGQFIGQILTKRIKECFINAIGFSIALSKALFKGFKVVLFMKNIHSFRWTDSQIHCEKCGGFMVCGCFQFWFCPKCDSVD